MFMNEVGEIIDAHHKMLHVENMWKTLVKGPNKECGWICAR